MLLSIFVIMVNLVIKVTLGGHSFQIFNQIPLDKFIGYSNIVVAKDFFSVYF
jgi:hypothetical protein